MKVRLILTMLMVVLLSSCSSMTNDSDSINGEPLTPFQPNLVGMEGKIARWSGVIAAVHNKADESVIEVVYLPLKSNGIPQQAEQSPGRFLAMMPGFLDPALYGKGRTVTILGSIGTPIVGSIGEHQYHFSVLHGVKHTLWPVEKDVEIQYVDPAFYNPYYDPFYDPYWLNRARSSQWNR